MASSEYFFSYSRKDSTFVLKLKNDLEKVGINVWLDTNNLRPGYDWDTDIQNALTASKYMLLVLSDASTKSDNVLDEMSYALDNKKLIIPLKIDNCEIPFRIARRQRIDFSENYELGLEKLLEALRLAKQPIEKTIGELPVIEHPVIPGIKQEEKIVPVLLKGGKKFRNVTFISSAVLILSITLFFSIKIFRNDAGRKAAGIRQPDSSMNQLNSHTLQQQSANDSAKNTSPQTVSKEVKNISDSGKTSIPPNPTASGNARVYFTYSKTNSEQVMPLIGELRKQRYTVVPEVPVSKSSTGKELTISYYFEEDKQEADTLLALIYKISGLPNIGKIVKIKNNNNVRKRHYDVRMLNLF